MSLVCAEAVAAMSADLIQISRTEYEALKAERDELQAALDAADGRTETIRIYEDLFTELGIDTAQPQEAIFSELRRRWDELVVAADPSVMENR